MWIERLDLNKFGKFKDESVSLSPNLNLILGNNESGKTTLTHAIDVIYNGFSPANHNYKYIPFDGVEADLEMSLYCGEKNYCVRRRLLKTPSSQLSYENTIERFKNEPLDAMILSEEFTPEVLDRRLWYFDHRLLGKKLDLGKWKTWTQLAGNLYLEGEKFSFSDIEARLNEKISNLYTNNSNSKSEIAKVTFDLEELEEKIRNLQAREDELKDIYYQLEECIEKKKNLRRSVKEMERKIEDLKELEEYKQKLLEFQNLKERWEKEKDKNSKQSELVAEYEKYLLWGERNSPEYDTKREQKKEWSLQKERLEEFYFGKSDIRLHLTELKKNKKFKEDEKENESHLEFWAWILFLTSLGILTAQVIFKILLFFKMTDFSVHFELFSFFIVIFFTLMILSGGARTYFKWRTKKHDEEIRALDREISKYEHDMDMGLMQIEEVNLLIHNLEEELRDREQIEKMRLSSFQEKLVELFGTCKLHECKEKLFHSQKLNYELSLYQSELKQSYERIKMKKISFFDDIVFEKESSIFDKKILQTNLQTLISNYELLSKNQNELILELSRKAGGYENRLDNLECTRLPSYEVERGILKEKLSKLKEEYSILVFLNEIFHQMKVLSYQKNRPDFEICLNRYFEEFLSEKRFEIRLNSRKELEVGRVDLIESLDMDRISTGTLAQIYFLFKLSILEKIDSNSFVPMIIDGAFDYYDLNRIKSIIKILEKISHKRQVIVLSSTMIPEFSGKIIKISD